LPALVCAALVADASSFRRMEGSFFFAWPLCFATASGDIRARTHRRLLRAYSTRVCIQQCRCVVVSHPRERLFCGPPLDFSCHMHAGVALPRAAHRVLYHMCTSRVPTWPFRALLEDFPFLGVRHIFLHSNFVFPWHRDSGLFPFTSTTARSGATAHVVGGVSEYVPAVCS
jgi:hypothetical protein